MQRIKRLLIPLLKGLPLLVGVFLSALFFAKKSIQYSVPKYQSMAKIKLDNHKYGATANNLYQDFDVFSTEDKIVTEEEIVKSQLLVERVIKDLNLDVYVARVGALKKVQLYKDNPFIFYYDDEAHDIYNKPFKLVVKNDHTIEIYKPEGEIAIVESRIGEDFQLGNTCINIELNIPRLNTKKLHIAGTYQFEIRTKTQWEKYIKGCLNVKAVDNNVPVIRVVTKTEDPILSADLANALCEEYIEDYIQVKSYTAKTALKFIEERINEIKNTLADSENKLELYKSEHGVINTRQETETGIRKLSQLHLQKIQLEIEETAITQFENYMANGDYYEKTAINIGFGDLTTAELVKKLKIYTDEKRDLLIKYTADSPKVVSTQGKIDDIEAYLKEAVAQNKSNILVRKQEIEKKVAIISRQFDDIPTREREMRILERDFQINETVYTFLAEKKLEAQIASSANIAFHRIIQKAKPNKTPVSPNKVLITFVSGLLGVIIGLILVYTIKFIKGHVQDKADVERITATPVLGIVRKTKDLELQQKDFATLATAIRLKKEQVKQTLLVTSSVKDEGKSYIANHIAKTYVKMGYTVALLDFNPLRKEKHYHNTIENLLEEEQNKFDFDASKVYRIGFSSSIPTPLLSHKKIDKTIHSIQQGFDIFIIDTPGSIISIDGLSLLQYATECLYIVRANKSRIQYLSNIDAIQEEYNFNKVHIIINQAPISSSFSGNFYGSQFTYKRTPKNIFSKLKRYYKFYS